MNTVNDKELAEYLQNQVITTIKVVRNKKNSYNVLLNLEWKGKEGDVKLVTSRGKWRSWVSLDRFIRHLMKKTDKVPPIFIEIPHQIGPNSKHGGENVNRTEKKE